jgi:hypothetical protein
MARPPPFIPADFTGSCVLQDGSLANFLEGQLHGLRAFPDGTRQRYEFGLLHSDKGAAVIHPDGRTEDWHRGRPRPHPDAAPVSAAEDRADREAMAADFASSADPWGVPVPAEKPEPAVRTRPVLLASKPEN